MTSPARRIVTEVLDAVVAGALPAAAPSLSVELLAAQHGCTLDEARAALCALEQRGIVRADADGERRIEASDRWKLLDGDVASAVLVRWPSAIFDREAVEAVRLVAPEAARLAAARAQRGDVAALAGILERMRRAGDDDAFAAAEADFHRTLALVSGNRFLAAMLEPLHPALASARRAGAGGRNALTIALHERIVEAIRDADPDATALAVEDYADHLGSRLER